MSEHREKAKQQRKYHPAEIVIEDWTDIEPYLKKLESADISTVLLLNEWMRIKSELEAILEEEAAWRYIQMNRDVENEGFTASFNRFVEKVQPNLMKSDNQLDKKFIEAPSIGQIDQQKYKTLIRAIKKKIELFKEENIPLFTQLQLKEQEFGKVSSKMTIEHDGRELTLQQASKYLKETDRKVREQVYRKISNRRLKDAGKLDDLFTELIKLRNKVAGNAGFKNYRDYKHTDLGRFDYQVKDCHDFHDAVQAEVVPIVKELHLDRKKKMKLDSLRPWDLEADPDGQPPLKPFDNAEVLVNKSIEVFDMVRPKFGEFLQKMKDNGYLDLDSRKGKAPGGFNYPLYESNIPFIFMNAAGNLRDLVTMMHEGGHAVHSFLSKDLELVAFKSLPSEVAELASMSMELISMDYWDVFFDKKDDLLRAKRKHLEDVLRVLPWIATIDKFQHWVYEHPQHTAEERLLAWNKIHNGFSSDVIDKSGLENYYKYLWQKQLHLFEVPFYYIEYGIAQLGAIAVWRNYQNNPGKALDQYEKALSLGYSVTIPEIYETAGISFDFSTAYIKELMAFVQEQLKQI